jgi:ribonuclease D
LTIYVYENDLPVEFIKGLRSVAVDTETMGLLPYRDRLCTAQFSSGDGTTHIVQFFNYSDTGNIKELLSNKAILKIFHFARFDVMMFYKHLNVMVKNLYCTKIASKLSRTYTFKHSLLDLCKELLNVEISKEQTCTDWGGNTLTTEQREYAANDVLYLHQLKEKLDMMLLRERRIEMAQNCFDFIETRVKLDLMTNETYDIFSHGA